jgi:uncharacterized membrane protein YkoI
MKKLALACILSLGSVAVIQAQDTTATPSDRYQTPTQDTQEPKSDYSDKDVISATELPAPIQEKLKGQDYTGWMVSKAFKKEKDGKLMYAVELKNGSDTKKVKFDADGNVLKEKE